VGSSTIRGVEERALTCRLLLFFPHHLFSKEFSAGMNKRKRVAIAKHRAKKKKLKARLAGAR
jgi:hypothetical protein